ncbi:acetyltransferase (GNAT) family protein [Halopolyspora algeriensis]|uniref:Acetyltransferase (GNAT) family protein n=1 Tax=Halopolyspora algeriensis TaxID=1500506 RepID=A0A368VSV3_9ACTN|nr:GNAT family N-acetyltransferase [Halopolyspora algeriensis]RCW45060.1 acetyltransferase (GNAT) family protein [Halopolyspora algeriensis]TQM53215.1 acetyltransferase (GNAT) family protein [Halopolyspora algeriensis]
MSELEFISGPHRVDDPHPDLPQALADLLGRATVAGGATGFTATTELDTITAAARRIVDDLSQRPKPRHVLTAGQERTLAGAVVLRPGKLPVQRHRGEIEWLLVDPELQGQGLEQQLLDAAAVQARALGLTQLSLSTRSGQGLEDFYADRGWVERGRWPGSLHVSENDHRDQVWFTLDL